MPMTANGILDALASHVHAPIPDALQALCETLGASYALNKACQTRESSPTIESNRHVLLLALHRAIMKDPSGERIRSAGPALHRVAVSGEASCQDGESGSPPGIMMLYMVIHRVLADSHPNVGPAGDLYAAWKTGTCDPFCLQDIKMLSIYLGSAKSSERDGRESQFSDALRRLILSTDVEDVIKCLRAVPVSCPFDLVAALACLVMTDASATPEIAEQRRQCLHDIVLAAAELAPLMDERHRRLDLMHDLLALAPHEATPEAVKSLVFPKIGLDHDTTLVRAL